MESTLAPKNGEFPGKTLIDEAIPSDFALKPILERFQQRLDGISPECLARGEFGWRGYTGSGRYKQGKNLPYSDQGTLDRMQDTGHEIYHDTTVFALVNALMGYVINKGWLYQMVPIEEDGVADSTIQRLNAALDRSVRFASMGSRRTWLVIQKESYRRLLRDGEFFRRWWISNRRLNVRFVEPMDIRQPGDIRQVRNINQLPQIILDQFGRDRTPPGELGIITAPGDVNVVIGFWRRIPGTSPEQFEFISSANCQHCKDNVDENDPRGVPAFYDGFCHVQRINEIGEAMASLAITQSEYAAVVVHQTANRREAIQSLVQSRQQEFAKATHLGKRTRELHLKNATLDLPGMKIKSAEFIDILQQEQRILGNLRQIPEFISTADANTGNRSSLVAAESPFARRVQSDQMLCWDFDEELLWAGVAAEMGLSGARYQNIRDSVVISVTFPRTETRDFAKDADAITRLLQPGVISKQEADRILGVNYLQMQTELGRDPVPQPTQTSPAGP